MFKINLHLSLSCKKARRGLCTHEYTDRGTNFVGGKSILNELYELSLLQVLKIDQVVSSFANKGTNWSLNPLSAPHFGGIWETNQIFTA